VAAPAATKFASRHGTERHATEHHDLASSSNSDELAIFVATCISSGLHRWPQIVRAGLATRMQLLGSTLLSMRTATAQTLALAMVYGRNWVVGFGAAYQLLSFVT
jgi:hypothetical protein